MATQLQIRRGTTAQMNAFTGAEGELAVNTTTDTVHVHDGSTAGGFALAKADGSNIGAYAGSFTTLTVDTDTLVVDATNNRVGVGTSSPSNSMTISNGSSGVTEANGAIVPLVVENSSSAYINFLTPNNANAGFLFSDPEGNNVGQMQYLHGSDALVFATSATERMRIDASGNLLVGRTATSGLGKLQVYGAADFAGGNVLLCRDTGNVGIGTTSLAAKLTVGTFGDTARAAQFHGGSILIDGGAATDLIMGDGNVAYMSLQTTDDATAMKIRDYSGNADLVTVERASGNVGIGTSSPDTTLHLQTPSGTKSEINFAQTAVTNYRIGVPASTDALVFTYGASTERMRISAEGYVTTPENPMFRGSYNGSNRGTGLIPQNGNIQNRNMTHTGGNRITVPVAGVYFILHHQLAATGGTQTSIWVNGSNVSGSFTQSISGSNESITTGLPIVLSANDYVEFNVYAGTIHGNANYSVMSVTLIG